MTQTAYWVGIDLGTTCSAAALCRAGDPRPEVVPLGGVTPSVASMVFLTPDGGTLCGEPAQRRAITNPRRVVREFKRRVGDGIPLVVDGHPVPAETVAARFVAWMLALIRDREGGPAERVALTHPAGWGPHKRAAMAGALAAHGVPETQFLSEPEAAAIGYASTARVEVGGTVAVYDLGGGTFDAAVVRKLPDGCFDPLGAPVGIEHLGGVDFDQAVFDHVREAVGGAWDRLDPADPSVQSAVAALRRECTAAKETLSADTEVLIPVMLPGHHQQVRLGRAEFEEAIRPAVAETVEALRRALDTAGVPEPDVVLLVGGSSRIPLVAQLVSAELGRPVAIDADPKSVIATGAAVAARGSVPEPAADPDPTVAVPLPAGGAGDLQKPPAPPAKLESAPSELDGRRARPRRGPIVALATAAALVVTFSVGAVTMAEPPGEPPAAPAAPAAAAPQPATEGEVDPWTGDAVTETTPSGPRRPRAVAAPARPSTRITETGAEGASAAAGPERTVDTTPPASTVVPAPAGADTAPATGGRATPTAAGSVVPTSATTPNPQPAGPSSGPSSESASPSERTGPSTEPTGDPSHPADPPASDPPSAPSAPSSGSSSTYPVAPTPVDQDNQNVAPAASSAPATESTAREATGSATM